VTDSQTAGDDRDAAGAADPALEAITQEWLRQAVGEAAATASLTTSVAPSTIERFTPTERVYHWVQAIPYLVCLLTGGGMLLWADGLHAEAREAAAAVHRWAGGALLVGVAIVVAFGRRAELFENARIACTWRREDLLWLLVYPLEELGLDVHAPPTGKFNPGQKLNLLGQLLLIPVFGVSGVFMWLTHGALLAWYAHVAAFCVAAPLVSGHLYLALVHRTTRKGLPGAFGGRVPRDWATEHYPLWVKEQDAEERRQAVERRVHQAVREHFEHEHEHEAPA